MSEATPEQANVETVALAAEVPAAPAQDESAPISPDAQPVGPAPDSALVGQVPASPAPASTLEDLKAELEGVYSRLEQYDAENKHLKEQLALHAASTAPDAYAALKQIAALAAPFA